MCIDNKTTAATASSSNIIAERHFSRSSFLCVSSAKLGSKFLVRVSLTRNLDQELGSCVMGLTIGVGPRP